jgi:hypothetical protein
LQHRHDGGSCGRDLVWNAGKLLFQGTETLQSPLREFREGSGWGGSLEGGQTLQNLLEEFQRGSGRGSLRKVGR